MNSQLSFLDEKHFYRTVPMTVQDEVKAEIQAVSQEERILFHMEKSGHEWTAWQLKEVFNDYEITSIRRSLFNLEKKQELIIQTGWVDGPKGKPVGKYKSK